MGINEKLNNLSDEVLKQFIELINTYKNFGLFDYYKTKEFINIMNKYNINIKLNNNSDINKLLEQVKNIREDFIKYKYSLNQVFNIIDFDKYANLYLSVKNKNFINEVDLSYLCNKINEEFILKRILSLKKVYYNNKDESKKKYALFKIFELQESLLDIINRFLIYNYNLYKDKLNINKEIKYDNLYIFNLDLKDSLEIKLKEYDNKVEYLENAIKLIKETYSKFFDKLININSTIYIILYNNIDKLDELFNLSKEIVAKREIYQVKAL